MRALILVTGLAFALAACGKDEQANNTVNIDQAVMSDDLVANDVTAIDAVTGEAANMAADVDINFTNAMMGSSNDTGARAEAPRSRPRSPEPRPQQPSTATPSADPAANTAATNATE